MRGDSLRDLYAKTLAVLGLGLLGAAGALVDYWPVRADLPVVVESLALPPVIQPLGVDREAVAAVAIDAYRLPVVTAAIPDADLTGARVLADDGDIGTPQGAALTVPGPPMFVVTATIPEELTDAEGVTLPPVSTAAASADGFLAPGTATPPEGVWVGMSRKTAHGVGKAGTAIADGFVKVGSAVGSAFGHLRSLF